MSAFRARVEFAWGEPSDLVAVVEDFVPAVGFTSPGGTLSAEDHAVLGCAVGPSAVIDGDDEAGAITVTTGPDGG